jgi:TPR repeat protein
MAEERGETYEICKKPEAPKQETVALDSKPHSFGVEPDANFSTELELAKKGNTQAQNNLGMMYMTGVGVAKNYSEAMKWLERSASKGNTQAMMNLASMYRDGSGVLPNNELAYSWFNLAADRSTSTEDKQYASQNVQELSKRLSNEQIGNALEYVTKLDEKIPDTKTN